MFFILYRVFSGLSVNFWKFLMSISYLFYTTFSVPHKARLKNSMPYLELIFHFYYLYYTIFIYISINYNNFFLSTNFFNMSFPHTYRLKLSIIILKITIYYMVWKNHLAKVYKFFIHFLSWFCIFFTNTPTNFTIIHNQKLFSLELKTLIVPYFLYLNFHFSFE